jgi:hypothetical protein
MQNIKQGPAFMTVKVIEQNFPRIFFEFSLTALQELMEAWRRVSHDLPPTSQCNIRVFKDGTELSELRL